MDILLFIYENEVYSHTYRYVHVCMLLLLFFGALCHQFNKINVLFTMHMHEIIVRVSKDLETKLPTLY